MKTVGKKFEEDVVYFGEITPGGSIEGVIVYNGSENEIDHVHPGCQSCTNILGKEEIQGKTYFKVKYKDSHVLNAGLKDKYPEGVIIVNKQVGFYMADGKDLTIPNPNGPGKVLNRGGKEKYNITYRVKVKF